MVKKIVDKLGRSMAVGLVAVGFMSQSAFALVSVEGYVGQRSGKLGGSDGEKATATEVAFGGHLDPIPLVPVGFGLSLSYQTFDVNKEDHGVTELTGMMATPEVVAWIPFFGDWIPYARLGYTIYGRYTGSGNLDLGAGNRSFEEKFSATGTNMGVGLKWSFLPLISANAEFQLGNHKWKVDSATYGSTDVKSSIDSFTFNSQAFLIGAEVGF